MFFKKILLELFGFKDRNDEAPGYSGTIDSFASPVISDACANDPWIQFMVFGTKPHGSSLEDILQFNRVTFDTHHDFIQWLFPNREASPINPLAPLLCDLHVSAYAELPELRASVEQSFGKFLSFLGLAASEPGFSRAPDFEQGAQYWLSPLDHNHRRISRVLTFLCEIGRNEMAVAMLAYFEDELSQANLSWIEALPYWKAILAEK